MKKRVTKIAGQVSLLLALILAMGATWGISSDRAEEQGPTITIPSTTTGIWAAIDKETDDITKAIQQGTLHDIHHHAYAIRDLVAALPKLSLSLDPTVLARLKADVKFVATLAARLDAAGDSNDKTESISNFNKLKAILTTLRAPYSKSANWSGR